MFNIMNLGDESNKQYYYGSPWEAEADRLGWVNRKENNTPWPDVAYDIYHILTVFY